jgi:hypothetical protein
MDNRLRETLENHGLPKSADDRAAQDFYAHLPLEEKGDIGVELGAEVRHADAPPLQTRDTDEELTTRSMSFRAATINEEDRSVEAIIATDQPVEVFDWARGERIDEVLLTDGAQLPKRIPLLNNHSRWSTDDVLGSARQMRTEEGMIVGRLEFVRDDVDVEKVWNKVRQGHLTDVSVGYRVEEAIEIEPGQSATIQGRTFTAKRRKLRIATRWAPKEVSVAIIGADQAAKMRKAIQFSTLKGGIPMPDKLRKYLVTLGLRAESTDAEAWAFYEKTAGAERTAAEALVGDATPPVSNRQDPQDPAEGQRSAKPSIPATPAEPQRQETPPEDPVEAGRQAVADERTRVAEIRNLAGDDVPEQLAQRAETEGWSLDKCSGEFLKAVREKRTPSAGFAIHSRNHETDCTVRSMAAGMLIGQGLDPTKHSLHGGHEPPRRTDKLTEEDADRGYDFRAISAVDLCRECAQRDTGKYHRDPSEAIRAAVSGGTLSHVFTTNVYARLIAGWEVVGDTTLGWCDEEDVANFQTQEDISLRSNSRLEKLPRGDTAKHADISDSHETYKIARFAKQFVADEQDFIDDRLGAIMRMPEELGEAARAVRPDMVYSLMLENPNLIADGGAVFNNTAVTTTGGHANLTTGALSSTNLKLAISAMVKQRLNRTTNEPGKALTIRPKYLIVPAELEWTARELTASAALAKLFADSNDPFYSQLNLLAQEGIRVVIDDRIGLIGVTDPHTGDARLGTDTNWFLTSGGSKGLRVAYRRGTGRVPSMRSFTLDRGQWGLGWDINLDIGSAFLDYRPWHKSTGAA